MTSEEMKATRRGTGLSQQGIANELGLSRKTINELENGAPVDRRTEPAMQTLARKIKLISDVYWVENSIRDTHIVARRTLREHDRPNALYYAHSEAVLYGEFKLRWSHLFGQFGGEVKLIPGFDYAASWNGSVAGACPGNSRLSFAR